MNDYYVLFYFCRHGAEVVDPREQGAGRKKTFTGTGYRLGQSNNDSEGLFINLIGLVECISVIQQDVAPSWIKKFRNCS